MVRASAADGANLTRVTRRPLSLVALVALAALVALVGCAGGDDDRGAAAPATTSAGTTGTAEAIDPATFEGGVVDPPRPAPPLALRDQHGQVIDIDDLRGHPVLVTFVYANCPDVCQLLMGTIAQAQRMLGPRADNLRVLAVSLDPAGDTPTAVAAFLERHGVSDSVSYLTGSRQQLERTWAAWGIEAVDTHSHAPGAPADHSGHEPQGSPAGAHETAGPIAHTSLTYGVSAGGVLRTAYPAGFPASGIARDVPILARS